MTDCCALASYDVVIDCSTTPSGRLLHFLVAVVKNAVLHSLQRKLLIVTVDYHSRSIGATRLLVSALVAQAAPSGACSAGLPS